MDHELYYFPCNFVIQSLDKLSESSSFFYPEVCDLRKSAYISNLIDIVALVPSFLVCALQKDSFCDIKDFSRYSDGLVYMIVLFRPLLTLKVEVRDLD